MSVSFFGKGKAKSDPPSTTEIAIEAIAFSPHQPRQSFDEERLAELAASIKQHGIIQPIVVRPVGNAYELVAGERRLRAARIAGLKKVPVTVREVSDEETAILALVENLQREDLNVIEEARGYRRLLSEYKVTQTQVGQLVGKGQSTIANKLRLLRLPESVQARILAEGVSERHARALLDLPDEASQNRMLDEIKAGNLSVRQTEERVRASAKAPFPAGLLPGGSVGRGAGSRRGAGASLLDQVSDRRAIKAFRDVRLFLNTFRRLVETLKEAGVPAVLTETDNPESIEVKVVIPKNKQGVSAGGVLIGGTGRARGGKGGSGRGRVTRG